MREEAVLALYSAGSAMSLAELDGLVEGMLGFDNVPNRPWRHVLESVEGPALSGIVTTTMILFCRCLSKMGKEPKV